MEEHFKGKWGIAEVCQPYQVGETAFRRWPRAYEGEALRTLRSREADAILDSAAAFDGKGGTPFARVPSHLGDAEAQALRLIGIARQVAGDR